MSGKELFEGMSYISDRFVDEAEHKMLPQSASVTWKKWASIAASLLLVIGCAAFLWEKLPFEGASSQDTVTGQESNLLENLPLESSPAAGEIITEMIPEVSEEVPSVILRVQSLTEDGFIGTVEQLPDTTVLYIGTELTAVWAEDVSFWISAEGCCESWEDFSPDQDLKVGSLVQVQFVDFDAEESKIVVEAIYFVEDFATD